MWDLLLAREGVPGRLRQASDAPSVASSLGDALLGDRSPADEPTDRRAVPSPDSALDFTWASDEGASHRGRKPSRSTAAPGSAFARIARTYAWVRAAIGVALVSGIGALGLLGARPTLPLVLICLTYALQAVLWWLLPQLRVRESAPTLQGSNRHGRRWLATVGVDLVAFTALHAISGESSVNFAALLVLPVLMAGVLSSRLVALATAAAVALGLLGLAWQAGGTGAGGALLLTQSGLAGLGLFLIAVLSGELASRLAREEAAARGGLELARQQAELNRLVIEEMADGALVVDHRLRVRASNPAARSLLAARGRMLAATFELRGRAEWSTLAQAVQRALDFGRWPDGGEDVQLNFGGGDVRALRLRVRFARRRRGPSEAATGEPFAVLLLEDARSAQARIRQEKLAAMGRVSAGIAHEIRNPLAAIAQANALLLEDPLSDAQTRLARIVADNVDRLRRIVDDVMAVAPGTASGPDAADATEVVSAAAADWAQTVGVAVGGRLRLDLPRMPLRVAFDAEHLRRVLVNLLDNALRHASGATGAIGVRLAARDAATALLLVDSDGPPIKADVERHLFEPFFSTRSRGTGLGLFICRELCQRYGATVEYRLRGDSLRNLFLVIMPRANPAEPARGGH